jgi:outer membrane protein assembly factor BamE (lipoprotein component of BamABCDE complex)
MTKTIRRVVLGAAVALTALVGGGAAVSHADDGSGACATRYEYRQVARGMTQRQVARIFGTWGKIGSEFNYDGYRYVDREYRPCRKYSYVSVSFSADPGKVLRVDGKFAYWS